MRQLFFLEYFSSSLVLLWPRWAAVALGCYISRPFCQGGFKPLVGLQAASPAEKLETEPCSEVVTFSYTHKCLSTLRCHLRKSHIPECFEILLLKWQEEADRWESRLESGTAQVRNGHKWMAGCSSLSWQRWLRIYTLKQMTNFYWSQHLRQSKWKFICFAFGWWRYLVSWKIFFFFSDL